MCLFDFDPFLFKRLKYRSVNNRENGAEQLQQPSTQARVERKDFVSQSLLNVLRSLLNLSFDLLGRRLEPASRDD